MGLQKWVEFELHPEQIPENPWLDAKLKPLETLRMTPGEILKAIPANPAFAFRPPTPLFQLVGGEQMQKIQNGTAEERKAALTALKPEQRERVLAQIAPPKMNGSKPNSSARSPRKRPRRRIRRRGRKSRGG